MWHLGKATVDSALYKEEARHFGDKFRQMSRRQNYSFLLYIGRSKRKPALLPEVKCLYSPEAAREENDIFCKLVRHTKSFLM